jgi:hypothetical protein
LVFCGYFHAVSMTFLVICNFQSLDWISSQSLGFLLRLLENFNQGKKTVFPVVTRKCTTEKEIFSSDHLVFSL